ncbi:retrovirus-related pol polyprotein from transposon TNT 1-94 [Tanacetum coccineum]
MDGGEPISDPSTYRSLVGKLLYLTITRPDLAFSAQALSQFLQEPTTLHMKTLLKQNVVSRSSKEAEYKALADTTCEITWLKCLLQEFKVQSSTPVPIICNNISSIALASNPVQHVGTKHIDIDCHFVRDKVRQGVIASTYVLNKSMDNDGKDEDEWVNS